MHRHGKFHEFQPTQLRLEAVDDFARTLPACRPGLLAHCRRPLHPGVLQGVNSKRNVMKGMAYGFGLDAYAFLRIRAFTGIGRGSTFGGAFTGLAVSIDAPVCLLPLGRILSPPP